MDIKSLTNVEANQLLHESNFVEKCWHNFSTHMQTGCVKCGDKLIMDVFAPINPDYCNSYDALMPVLKSLDKGWMELLWLQLDADDWDLIFMEIIHVPIRDIVNALLEIACDPHI